MDWYIQGHEISIYMYMDIVYVGYGEPDGQDTGYTDLVIRTCLCRSELEGGKGYVHRSSVYVNPTHRNLQL